MVGVDIGGTFTDFVLYDPAAHAFHLHKLLTNPVEPERCVIEGVQQLLDRTGVEARHLNLVIHGTTLITNALIEGRGAPTALLATQGHRDVVESGNEMRYDPYNLFLKKPDPLVPRQRRLGVVERLGSEGQVITPLAESEMKRVAEQLQALGVTSVAICFLHAFRNPEHEQQAAAFLAKYAPELSVSLSSSVAPEIREYYRTSTTVANAYVKPLAEKYLRRLAGELGRLGYRHPLYLMLSGGGVTVADFAAQYPIHLLESGPAGGALFASLLGRVLERPHLISFDMGGTTAKMTYIHEGKAGRARTFEVARVERFLVGSGLPVQVPVIEMIEIGAGGGSIAHKDHLDLLKVGPRSAGASPGPACYGLGGTEPTVTDANLLLGYLSPDNFLGGRMALRPDLAEAAMRRVAEPLGISVIDAAKGIFEIVNQNMVAATKVHAAERAQDPRRAALVAFGGAGPIHAHALARALGIQEVICPLRAGAASALGFLTAPIAFEFALSLTARLGDLPVTVLADTFAALESRGRGTLAQAGIAVADMRIQRSLDLRHAGQGRHEVEVDLPSGEIDAGYLANIPQLFFDAYRRLYGQAQTEVPIETVTCRLVASGPPSTVELPRIEACSEGSVAEPRGHRPVYFSARQGFVETALYSRYALRAGMVVNGPAIIEEHESTVVVSPDMHAKVDPYGNLILSTAR